MALNMQTEPLSVKMARSVINRFLPEHMLWHYEYGLVLQSIYAVGKSYGLPGYDEWVKERYDTKINPDGSIQTYRKEEYNLDQINPGKHLFDLYADTKDKKYRVGIEVLRNQLRTQPRTQSGGFWHKKIYPWQMWLDGLYMQGPFYARYAAEFGSEEDFDDIVRQFELVYVYTRNPQSGLLYHAWDESCKQLWANPETGCSPHFWGRAMGWYCMALLDVLDWMPDTPVFAARREKLIRIANELVKPILSVQDSSGLWYQVLDMPLRAKNYLETSASSMFVRFLYKIQRVKLFNAEAAGVSSQALTAASESGFAGLCSRVTEDADGTLHLSGICSVAGLGGNPYRDGSFEYYIKEAVVSDDYKGTGPFILACMEHEAAKQPGLVL